MEYPTDGILERHDFVMVGYRGIDGQVVLECAGDRHAAIRAVEHNHLSDAALRRLRAERRRVLAAEPVRTASTSTVIR